MPTKLRRITERQEKRLSSLVVAEYLSRLSSPLRTSLESHQWSSTSLIGRLVPSGDGELSCRTSVLLFCYRIVSRFRWNGEFPEGLSTEYANSFEKTPLNLLECHLELPNIVILQFIQPTRCQMSDTDKRGATRRTSAAWERMVTRRGKNRSSSLERLPNPRFSSTHFSAYRFQKIFILIIVIVKRKYIYINLFPRRF